MRWGSTLACGLVILILSYLLFFGTQTVVLYEVHHWASKEPALAVRPKPLELTKASSTPGTVVSSFGYQFEVPWKDAEAPKLGESFVRVASKSGLIVLLSDPAKQVDALNTLNSAGSGKRDQMRAVLGDIRTNYALEAAALNWTPDQVSLFMPRTESARSIILAMYKSIWMGDATSGVYTLTSSSFRGFQFGDPVHSQKVSVHLFDTRDHLISLTFSSLKGSGAKYSQEEINRVIQTLRASEGSGK